MTRRASGTTMIGELKEACVERSLEARRARGMTVSEEVADTVTQSSEVEAELTELFQG